MGKAHLLFLLQETLGSIHFTACQELNSAGNNVAAALQSLTGRNSIRGMCNLT
jgi:hypothetical protein